MIAVNPLFHGKYPGTARHDVMEMRRVGYGTETKFEQALWMTQTTLLLSYVTDHGNKREYY
jgi:hypothetical protein